MWPWPPRSASPIRPQSMNTWSTALRMTKKPPVGEGLRRGILRRPAVAGQRFDRRGAEGPEHLARVPPEGLLQRRDVPGSADEPGEVAVVVEVLPAERQRASVVRIAPQRDRAVRPGVGRGEARHRPHALAVGLRDVETERLAIEGGQQEELGDQAVVRDRSLEVDAVRVDLPRDLVAQDRPGPRLPAPRVLALAEEEAGEGRDPPRPRCSGCRSRPRSRSAGR